MRLNKRAILKAVNENLNHYRVSYNTEWKEYRVIPNFTFSRSVTEKLTHYTDSLVDAIETAASEEKRRNADLS